MLLLGKMKKRGQTDKRYSAPNLVSPFFTVWKVKDFSITQILREINFGDSRSAKSAIFTF